jgi:hypothetical protein
MYFSNEISAQVGKSGGGLEDAVDEAVWQMSSVFGDLRGTRAVCTIRGVYKPYRARARLYIGLIEQVGRAEDVDLLRISFDFEIAFHGASNIVLMLLLPATHQRRM